MTAANGAAGNTAPIPLAAPIPDPELIRSTLNVLYKDDSLIELRALYTKGRKRTDAGYFDCEHREVLVEEAVRLNKASASVYVTLNEIDRQLLARHANRVQEYAASTVTDANVTRRCWLLIDLDPQRPKDTSATDEQLELATERARSIYRFLAERQWPKPVTAESGNGMHLLYRVDLPNDEGSRDLVKSCLEALAAKFDDEVVKVDRSVFNAARIVKLHGTVACKGDNLPFAPWRLSKLRSVPDEVIPVPRELLDALAAEVRSVQRVAMPSSGSRTWQESDVQAFLARGGIEAAGPELHDGALRWKLKVCPFNPDHGYAESAVFLSPDGRLGFKCLHNSCQDKHWLDLRTLVDGARENRVDRAPRASVSAAPAEPAGPQTSTEWPPPAPLPDGLPRVAAFDFELLPPILREFVEDIAERMQCPADFPAVAAMVVLATIVGRRVGIAPKRHDSWTVIPNLWAIGVGRPGMMKSPALMEVVRLLQVLQARALSSFENQMADRNASTLLAEEAERVAKDAIRKALKKGDKVGAAEQAQAVSQADDDAPVCRRYLISDATVEKLGELLKENPQGLLLYRDELAGFFRTLERQGHEADRAFYLECWNGDGSFVYDRIGRGTIHIPAACLSILGSIQPGPLSELVRGLRGGGDDGLLQRFQLAVWPDSTADWRNIDRPPNAKSKAAVVEMIERLDRLPVEPLGPDGASLPVLRFTPEAQDLFDRWRESLERRIRGDIEHPMFEAHLAKFRSLIPSLALLVHLAEHTEGNVELLALERAIGWGEYLESHARRIYAPALAPDLDAARCLAKRIKSGDVPERFALRDVYNNSWSGLSTREQVASAASVLVDHDWLRETIEPTSGRARTVYVVNPAVRGGRS